MAQTKPQVLTSVKNRLSIKNADTTWDTQLNDFLDAALRRLYPAAAIEVATQIVSNITVDTYGECNINLSTLVTPIKTARKVEAYDGYTWRKISATYHHGVNLQLRGLGATERTLRIFGLTNFATMTDVPDEFLQAVYWYTMSEFYDYLAGNKSNYNIYMQTTGARAVDNMHDESVYYDQKAEAYLDEQKQDYGS